MVPGWVDTPFNDHYSGPCREGAGDAPCSRASYTRWPAGCPRTRSHQLHRISCFLRGRTVGPVEPRSSTGDCWPVLSDTAGMVCRGGATWSALAGPAKKQTVGRAYGPPNGERAVPPRPTAPGGRSAFAGLAVPRAAVNDARCCPVACPNQVGRAAFCWLVVARKGSSEAIPIARPASWPALIRLRWVI